MSTCLILDATSPVLQPSNKTQVCFCFKFFVCFEFKYILNRYRRVSWFIIYSCEKLPLFQSQSKQRFVNGFRIIMLFSMSAGLR